MEVHELIVRAESMSRVSARRRPGDGEADDDIALDPLDGELVEYFQKLMINSQTVSSDDIRLFGKLLFRILFPEKIRSLFERAYRERPKDQRLRVQLTFRPEARTMASWPWEYLYYPKKGESFFFATNPNLVLSRYMPYESDREETLTPQDPPLRILVVISQPSDQKDVLPGPVIDAINQLAADERYRIVVDSLQKPRVDSLVRELTAFAPHIVHFIGHGRYNYEMRRGEIALHNEIDETQWLADTDFAYYFSGLDTKPRLIFLHMCESAVSDLSFNVSGVSPQLIEAQIPSIVAMQHPISNKVAIAFSQAFYGAIARGEPVENAVQEGRKRITESPVWSSQPRALGTPVLHLQSHDSIITPAPIAPVATESSAGVAGPKFAKSPAASAEKVGPAPERSVPPPIPEPFKTGAESAATWAANQLPTPSG